jgi:hypothetical protein
MNAYKVTYTMLHNEEDGIPPRESVVTAYSYAQVEQGVKDGRITREIQFPEKGVVEEVKKIELLGVVAGDFTEL